jgi:hypothetical protein
MINKQKHKETCGQTAVYNALRNKGVKVSYRDITDVVGLGATDTKQLEGLLLSFNIKYKIIKPTFKKMEKELSKNRSLILTMRWEKGKGSGHHFFIQDYTPKHFIAYNYNSLSLLYKDTNQIPRKELARHIRFSYRNYPKRIQAIVLL